MKFTDFIKNYFSNLSGPMFRCSLVALLTTALNFRKEMILASISVFPLVFVVYLFVDIALEWMKEQKKYK